MVQFLFVCVATLMRYYTCRCGHKSTSHEVDPGFVRDKCLKCEYCCFKRWFSLVIHARGVFEKSNGTSGIHPSYSHLFQRRVKHTHD